MNNFLVIAIYAPFAVITAGIFVADLLRRYKRQEHNLFTLLCLCAVCWYVFNMAGTLTSNVEFAKFCINFVLTFVGFIPPLLLLFVLEFYRVSVKLTRKRIFLLFLVPIINTFMTLTANYHTLVTSHLEITSLSPMRLVAVEWGPWFWVHTAYSYAISMVIVSEVLFQHFKVAKFYRIPSTMMAIGISITLVGNIITLLQLFPYALDPTLITMSLSIIFFDLAIINNNNSKFVRFSRGQVFHYLNEFILVLDEKERIVDFNQPAKEWFTSQGINLQSSAFCDVMDKLFQIGEIEPNRFEEQNNLDIRVSHGMFPLILSVNTKKMTDIRGDEIGAIVVFTDVTENRKLLEQLEAKAGIDSLTGLPNHMAYTGAKKRLDDRNNYPLTVVVCDANGLKYVNDTYGHQYGDILLKTIAEAFDRLCPRQSFVARIGGDEFIFLLRRTSPLAAEELMTDIKMELTKARTPFPVTVAMGAATKFELQTDLDEIIAKADKEMYADKSRIKKEAIIQQSGDNRSCIIR